MTSALVLAIGALILGIGAITQLLPQRDGADRPTELRALPRLPLALSLLETVDGRLGLSTRLTRAGVTDRISAHALLAAKSGAPWPASCGDGRWPPLHPAASPGSWRSGCPPRDSSDLMPGSSDAPASAYAPSGRGSWIALDLSPSGPPQGAARWQGSASSGGREGAPGARARDAFSRGAPAGYPERGARVAAPPRPRRRLRCAALSSARAAMARHWLINCASRRRLCGECSRRIEEHAARAAPKIQLAVALPSVLLMIAAGLLANIDRFMAGF